ncbi:hypothetical protein [Carnobacterium mobile]|uniref:hypothetical protein n=1 Tax=Carnobacterium mobile TaxID=2750 RepID=UPI00055988F0|nr:hypothetical protein [Carnobacterium mobile]
MVSFLTFGSLGLGLIAWILAIVNLIRYKNNRRQHWATFSILSVAACAVALYFPLVYSSHLVNIGDLSALMDTIATITSAAAILLIVTLILNGLALILYRNHTKK